MLKNKNILVAVTGSIAIYKTCELIRLFVKNNANVRIVMTQSAKKFISPLIFETLSSHKVLDDCNEDWSSDFNHIAIGKWADIFIIAPATANTINKLANGLADNMLTQIALAYPRVKILAPAANTNMIENPLTVASLKMLKLCNYEIVEPATKELACKDIGNGALADVETIFYKSARALLKDAYWENRKVVVSAGGTIERIDDVRYISNFSSGKMGLAIAEALYLRGADVCLIKTKNTPQTKCPLHTIEVENSAQMLQFVSESIVSAKQGIVTKNTLMDNSMPQYIKKKPFFFSVAAISDYIPKFHQKGKLKKEQLGESWELSLTQNIDILNTIDKGEIFTIGFKAEMDAHNAKNNAKQMLEKKNLDGVCLNILGDEIHFGSDENQFEFITQQGVFTLAKAPKKELSFSLLELIKKSFINNEQ